MHRQIATLLSTEAFSLSTGSLDSGAVVVDTTSVLASEVVMICSDAVGSLVKDSCVVIEIGRAHV